MGQAEFEEKEYEGAANGELGLGGFVMSAGQVIEEIVGYDAVAAPVARHVIWQLLRVPRPPGVHLLPRLWPAVRRPPAHRLPHVPVSLILQYKRPEFLHAPNATQWSYWHQPYYRFTRSEAQHRVLRRLDRLLQGQAEVRYAAPVFHRSAELEAAVVTRQVLELTGFVSPRSLGSHRIWTYVAPGIQGRANPTGRQLRFDSIDELSELLSAPPSGSELELADSPGERLAAHLRALAAAAGDREPSVRARVREWERRVRHRDPLISQGGMRQLVDLATICSVLHRAGASWLIIDRAQPLWRGVSASS